MNAPATRHLTLTAGRASMDLAARVAEHLQTPMVDAGLKTFSGGEVYCRYQESVRDTDLVIFQSIARTPEMTPNDALMELLLMVDAAQGASARNITAVVPWYGYSRQDKKSAPREPISARVVAQTLQVVGIDRLITMDLHAGQLQGLYRVPADHLTAFPLLADFVKHECDPERTVIIAPDAGRVKLTQKFSSKVGMPYALLEKRRPRQQEAEIGYVIGDVKGKTAVIVDDMIDTGGTLAVSAQTLLEHGAERVFALATHGIFSGAAYETLGDSVIERIVTADTVLLPPGAPDKITQIDTSRLFADSVSSNFMGESISEIFDGDNQIF